MEILWRDSLRCPTEEEYISMVNQSGYKLTTETCAHASRNGRATSDRDQAHDGLCNDEPRRVGTEAYFMKRLELIGR